MHYIFRHRLHPNTVRGRLLWRRHGERYAEVCVRKNNSCGGGSVHIWGGITFQNRTRLVVFDRNVNANAYVYDVLDRGFFPVKMEKYPAGFFKICLKYRYNVRAMYFIDPMGSKTVLTVTYFLIRAEENSNLK